MDYRDFRAAAYSNNSGKNNKDKEKKTQTGEVIRNTNTSVKPMSFQSMNLTDFSKQKEEEISNSSSLSNKKVTNNVFSSMVSNSQSNNSSLEGRKISTPSWTQISKNDSVPESLRDKTVKKASFPSFSKNDEKAPTFNKTVENNKSTISKTSIKSSKDQLEDATDFLKSGGLIKVPVEESKTEGKDSPYRRVAKFLVLIGEEEAAKVLPLLSEPQIERIIPEIASIRTINKDEATVILEEFNGIANKVSQSGGIETARDILRKAYGNKRADELIKKAMPMEGRTPFAYLKELDAERINLLLKDENIGMQALVLSYLPPKKSAGVINLMTPENKKQVVLRLANMEPVSPEVLRRVDQAMHEKSLHQTVESSENIDGRNALAQILKKMDVNAENDILESLSDADPDLGQDLRSRLFTLDDVINADDRFVQEKLHEMSEVDIAYLIAGKSKDFEEKILSNISANRRAEVREQDKILTVKRKDIVDQVTSAFMAKLRVAFEKGELVIKDRNDEEFV